MINLSVSFLVMLPTLGDMRGLPDNIFAVESLKRDAYNEIGIHAAQLSNREKLV